MHILNYAQSVCCHVFTFICLGIPSVHHYLYVLLIYMRKYVCVYCHCYCVFAFICLVIPSVHHYPLPLFIYLSLDDVWKN
jgi:hypothetical protein